MTGEANGMPRDGAIIFGDLICEPHEQPLRSRINA